MWGRNAFSFAGCALVAVLFVARCHSSPTKFDESDAGLGEETSDLDVDLGGGEGGESGAGCGAGDPVTCSGDLHSVLCNGNVIQTCPPDQGCANGTCVPACDAAIANKSTIGCEYYAHNPLMVFGAGCFALFVANTWNADITLTGEAGGKTINLTKYAYLPKGTGPNLQLNPVGSKIPAGKVAIVFLRDNPNPPVQGVKCPMPAAETDANASGWTDPQAGTNSGRIALRVTSSAPVVVYDILPFGGGKSAVTDATLLLPTSTWDTNYVVVTPRPLGNNTLNPAVAIVAQADGTTVTVRPTVNITAGTNVVAATANQPQTYNLNRAQVLRFEQAADLNGSIVQTNKPVGVWGEQSCINIDASACDGAHEQIPPVRALGSEYAVVRYKSRSMNSEETPPVRIVGAVDGTQLSYDPAPPQMAPTTINEGQSVDVRSNNGQPFIVKSQDDKHPFYVAAYMTGGAAFNGGDGDPEFVNVIPTAQYLNRYLFFTDPTYPTTNLVFIRKKAQDNTFKDVKLDCGPTLTGWKPVGNSGQLEYVRWDISNGKFMGANGCDNGAHEATSAGAFQLTVWAWSTADDAGYCSYAYPAGASVQSINTVVIPPNPK